MQIFNSILHLIFLLLIAVNQVFAQQSGTLFIRNYPPKEYKAETQNWAIVQDSRGIMFFGNNNGLLEYDGIEWRLFKFPLGVRSTAIDSVGRILIGSDDDFGYILPDKTGNYQYYSLKSKLPKAEQNIATCWQIYVLDKTVFFQTFEKLYIYKHDTIKVISPKTRFHVSFVVNNRFYIREREKGLFYYTNDSLVFIEGSEIFAEERIYAILPYHRNEALIASRTKGIYIYSPDNPKKFCKQEKFNEVDHFLIENPVLCGTIMENGEYALGTVTNGLIVFDQEGKIKSLYNKSNGLQDNTVTMLFNDQNGQLWVALDKGISLIQNNLPFHNYNELNGLQGGPVDIEFFKNHLYVATGQYLHIRTPKGTFEPITGTEGQNFHLLEANNTLLLAHNSGIFEIRDMKAIAVENTSEIYSYKIFSLKNHPGYVLGGAQKGLYLLEYKNSAWKLKHHIKGFEKEARRIICDGSGNIWISEHLELYKLQLNNRLDSIISYKQFDNEKNFKATYPLLIKLNNGEILFSTSKGIFRYLPDLEKFEIHTGFSMLTSPVYPFCQDQTGNIWFEEMLENGNYEKGVLKFSNGKYILNKTPFYKFTDIDSYGKIYTAPDSTIYWNTSIGLLQYNPLLKVKYDITFNTLIRKVLAKDSLLFYGASLDPNNFKHIKGNGISYNFNDLFFHYTSTFYEDAEKNLYSYRLIGYDTIWSDWVKDYKKEYTNLKEGNYIFEVKSKNQYLKIGSTASYSFRLLPPWYRTWWAYTSYVILSILFIWTILKFYTRRLIKQKEHLEKVVKERTAEVVQQKKEIEGQRDVLTTQTKRITDSINYAKKIQNAVLPKSEILEKILPEHFIFFKPRDIVSGDFYFIKKINQYLLIAAVDCTGHGVPGAFMSMLGIALLNEIVRKSEIKTSAQVLNELRYQIKNSLQQTGAEDEPQDGMDIAFCTINYETLEMSFAGAQNPCWIFRNGGLEIGNEKTDKQMIILEEDCMPVGIFIKEKEFSEQIFQLQKGDVFYIFSDGFHSQFGGEPNGKYKTKRLKEFLQSMCHYSLNEQKLLLEKEFNSWKGEIEQTDDVLVIGVRV